MDFRSACLGVLLLSACTRQVEVTAVKPSTDFSGLTKDERQRTVWAAFDVVVPASVARSIRRWELSNVTLNVFRCNHSEDFYPAEAKFNGQALKYDRLTEPLPPSSKLTFYVPQDPGHRETNVCAALDARGYSPVFLRSQTVRLPALSMIFYHYDEETGRSLPTQGVGRD